MSSADMRRSNLALVLSQVHTDGALSRSELSARTGLTRSAIQGLVGALVDEGLVVESRAESDGTPGRPSPLVQPVAAAAVAIAVEIAVDVLTVAVIGLGGSVVQRVRLERSRRSSVDVTVRQLVDGLRSTVQTLDASTRLVGIGVAVAGQVDHRTGSVSLAPNLGWVDVDLGAALSTHLADLVHPSVAVRIGNEAQLGALAEHRRGAARGADDVLYVAGEVGVGGGLILGGALHLGSGGTAGELGHTVLHPDGEPCRCGARGCWETEVSEGALLARAGRRPDGGRAEIDDVVAAALEGDPLARTALTETAHWIGLGVGSLVNILDPQLVVLGGWFTHGASVFLDDVVATVERVALPSPRRRVRVVPAQLGDDASLLGAAELAFESLLTAPVG
jgi:predicted NBD/HSP70 family sugar kinase/biotin operon repressor